MARALYAPTKARTDKARAELKAMGIRANVRRFNHCIRVVLPDFGATPEVADVLRDFMVSAGYTFAGGSSPTLPTWRTCWTHYQGRAQFFLYDIR